MAENKPCINLRDLDRRIRARAKKGHTSYIYVKPMIRRGKLQLDLLFEGKLFQTITHPSPFMANFMLKKFENTRVRKRSNSNRWIHEGGNDLRDVERRRMMEHKAIAEEYLRVKSRTFALRRLRRREAKFQTHTHKVLWLEDVLKLLNLNWVPKRGWKLLFYDASEYSKILKEGRGQHLDGCVPASGEKFYAVKSYRGEIRDIAEVQLPTHCICIMADYKGFKLIKLVLHELADHMSGEAHAAYVEGPNAFFRNFDRYTREILASPQVPAELKLLTQSARKQCTDIVEQIEEKGYWAKENFIDKIVSLLIREYAIRVEDPEDRAERLLLSLYQAGSKWMDRLGKLTGRDRALLEYFSKEPKALIIFEPEKHICKKNGGRKAVE